MNEPTDSRLPGSFRNLDFRSASIPMLTPAEQDRLVLSSRIQIWLNFKEEVAVK